MTDSKKRKLEGAPAAQTGSGGKGDRALESIPAKVGRCTISRHLGALYIRQKLNLFSTSRRPGAW